jgi:hypothetical protein
METISENKETPSSFTWLSRAASGLEGGGPDYASGIKVYGSLKKPKLSNSRN